MRFPSITVGSVDLGYAELRMQAVVGQNMRMLLTANRVWSEEFVKLYEMFCLENPVSVRALKPTGQPVLAFEAKPISFSADECSINICVEPVDWSSLAPTPQSR